MVHIESNNSQEHTKYYNNSGMEVPSCTTIVGILNKPGLIGWANHMGFKRINVNKFLIERASKGTEYHTIAEQYLTGMLYNNQHSHIIDDKEYEDLIYKLQVLQDSFNSCGIRVVNTEMQLHGSRYGGTLDLLCQYIDTGEFLLFDFKSSKSVHETHFIQLAGYSMLLEELHQISVSKIGVILLSKSPKDKKFMNFLSREENRKNEKIFNKLVDIYWIQANES